MDMVMHYLHQRQRIIHIQRSLLWVIIRSVMTGKFILFSRKGPLSGRIKTFRLIAKVHLYVLTFDIFLCSMPILQHNTSDIKASTICVDFYSVTVLLVGIIVYICRYARNVCCTNTVTLTDIEKNDLFQTTTKHGKARNICMILEKYCISRFIIYLPIKMIFH